jgi:hypothetical protein
MKMLSAVAVLLMSGSLVRAAEPAGSAESRFGWLAGCWGGERGTTAFREIWTVASPELLVGMAVTTRPSRPAEFEFLRIEVRAGHAAYVAQPGGVPPTAFDWSPEPSTADTAVFVNPKHDFPKRVAYRRVGADAVQAWIDGGEAAANRIEFPMKRIACPGGR